MHKMSSWPPSDCNLNASNFHEKISSHHFVAVHFYGVWSLSDKMQSSIIEITRKDYSDIAFFSFDIDPEDGWPISRECEVLTTPSLVFFVNGKQKGIAKGFHIRRQLQNQITNWIRNAESK